MNNTIVGLFTLNYHLSKPLGKATTSGGKYCNWNLFLLLYISSDCHKQFLIILFFLLQTVFLQSVLLTS